MSDTQQIGWMACAKAFVIMDGDNLQPISDLLAMSYYDENRSVFMPNALINAERMGNENRTTVIESFGNNWLYVVKLYRSTHNYGLHRALQGLAEYVRNGSIV